MSSPPVNSPKGMTTHKPQATSPLSMWKSHSASQLRTNMWKLVLGRTGEPSALVGSGTEAYRCIICGQCFVTSSLTLLKRSAFALMKALQPLLLVSGAIVFSVELLRHTPEAVGVSKQKE